MTLPDDLVDELLSAPDKKRGRIQRDILKLLAEHEAEGGLPTNNRFVYYELEMAGQARKPTSTGSEPAGATPANAWRWTSSMRSTSSARSRRISTRSTLPQSMR